MPEEDPEPEKPEDTEDTEEANGGNSEEHQVVKRTRKANSRVCGPDWV